MTRAFRVLTALGAAAVFVLNLYVELSPDCTATALTKLLFAFSIALLLYFACLTGVTGAARQKMRHDFFTLLFWYYLWVLANILFFDSGFGRGFHPDFTFSAVNLEPLRTIRNYLSAYRYGNISLELTVLNLAGNLVAFMPMGVLLPALFRWQRSVFFFTASMLQLVAAVEVVQVYTGTGSMDIDDLILNVTGALLVYLVCRMPPLWRRICGVTPRKEYDHV